MPRLDAFAQRLALVGDGKIDVRGGAAEGRRLVAGVEIVGRFRHADGQLQMRVHVDAAGQHVAIGRVDHLRAFGLQTFANHGDLLAVDQQIGFDDVAGGNEGSVLDDSGHGQFL